MKNATLIAGLAIFLSGNLAAPGRSEEPASKGAKKMAARVEKKDFGKTADGTAVELYVLTNANGLVAKVTSYGAILTEVHAPNRDGKMEDVVLGFDDLKGYLGGHPFFGATTGRVANRIAKGKFTLDGKEYTLAVNNGPNTLHGGLKGFDKAVWKADEVERPEAAAVKFTHTSPDGDEGFPGNLAVTVVYSLTNQNEVRIDYAATTDKPTLVNLTNHSYFNLAGPASGNVLGQEVMIAADEYTPSDETLIPTGELKSVKGTFLDFTSPMQIGARFDQIKSDPAGYDHNYVLRTKGDVKQVAVRARDPKSGRVMEMYTTEPGVQLYTSNFLGKTKGKGGVEYEKHQAFCLEAQHYPDSVHHDNFPTTVLRPGKTYTQTTIYKFSAK